MTAKKKRPVTGGMRVKAYDVIRRCVEMGVRHGYRRAHKHTATPGEEHIFQQTEDAVLAEICEAFNFDEGES